MIDGVGGGKAPKVHSRIAFVVVEIVAMSVVLIRSR